MYGIGFNNSPVRMGESIDGQWAQIDNQLLRRSDLIPNLVNTVKGYAKHEKDDLHQSEQRAQPVPGGQHRGGARPRRRVPSRPP